MDDLSMAVIGEINLILQAGFKFYFLEEGEIPGNHDKLIYVPWNISNEEMHKLIREWSNKTKEGAVRKQVKDYIETYNKNNNTYDINDNYKKKLSKLIEFGYKFTFEPFNAGGRIAEQGEIIIAANITDEKLIDLINHHYMNATTTLLPQVRKFLNDNNK
jgi:hypothetical protein